jgi:hypothetical protein
MVATFGLVVGLAAATIVVVGAEGLVDSKWVDRLLTIGSVAIVSALGFTIIVLAPWSLWREQCRKLSELEAGRLTGPYVAMVLPPPMTKQGESRLVITVENSAPEPRTFAAKIHGLGGLTSTVRPPWWVPWSDGAEVPERRLFGHEMETLEIGTVTPVGITTRRIPHDGEPATRASNDLLQFAASESALCLRL